jgi:hypothetical protein
MSEDGRSLVVWTLHPQGRPRADTEAEIQWVAHAVTHQWFKKPSAEWRVARRAPAR